MPLDLNEFPYFDDFSEMKDYYRILFRPGYSVQARELTQLQTILQNQIEKFGKHIFKNGSIVVGGQTTLNLNAKYLKIKSTHNGETVPNGGITVTLSSFVGQKIKIYSADGQTELAQAVVVTTHTESNENYLILSEIYGDISATTIPAEARIYFEGSSTQDAEVVALDYFGQASIASINEGIFFVDGIFTRVDSQTILVELTSAPSKKIGLTSSVEYTTNNEDSSLLDNARGFSNYNSPGAHRLKITLTLDTRDLESSENLTDFIELIRVEDGDILKQVVYSQYAELEKTLARRTYDESGSYTVSPFKVKSVNQFKGTGTVTINAGVVTGSGTLFTDEIEQDSVITVGDQEYTVLGVGNDTSANVTPTNINVVSATKFYVEDGKKLTLRVSPGKAYVKGFEFETIAPNDLVIAKAREVQNDTSHDFPVIYGGYVVVEETYMAAEFNFSVMEKVNLLDWDTNIIGNARIKMVSKVGDYFHIYLTEINLNSGISFGVVRILASITNPTEYAWIDTINGKGTVDSISSGNVTIASTSLSGVGTKFLTELREGSLIIVNNVKYYITGITSDILATTATVGSVTIPTTMYIRDAVLKENNKNSLVFPVGYNNISNLEEDELTETFTDISYFIRRRLAATTTSTTEINFSVSSPYEFSTEFTDQEYQLFEYNAGATNASPHVFTFPGTPLTNFNRTITLSGTFDNSTPKTYVLYATLKVENITPRIKTYVPFNATILDTDSITDGRRRVSSYNMAGNDYTISLNKSDVSSVSAVYFNPTVSGGDVTDGEDITTAFEFDNGQRDTHYDFASITLKPEFRNDPKYSNGVILVLFNYWQHSNSISPIVSRSYSNYNIIPSYTSSNTGIKYVLRDCVDFRPIRGDGTSESDKFSSLGAEAPTPVGNFTANVSFYKGRKDRLVVTSERKFELYSGIASMNPTYPSINEDLMNIYNIDLGPYTYNENDLRLNFVDNRRYTMKDIAKIDTRLRNVEYYTALSLLEKNTNDLLIKDGAGNTRFKNGFVVDNFSGHNIGDVSRGDYTCSIDFENNELRPRFTSRNFKLNQTDSCISTVNSAEKAVVAGDLVLIPYVDTKTLVSQLQCSGYVNVNPYSVFSWTGQLRLAPASDFWTETSKRPDVIVNLDNNLDNVLSGVNFEGTRWNDWEVTWSGVDQDTANALRAEEIRNLQAGNTAVPVTATTIQERIRTGLQVTGVSSALVDQSLGNRIVDVSVLPFIRQSTVTLSASSLKPNTRIYVFMDGINVTSLMTASGSYNPSAGVFKTDSVGNFVGVLNIPNPNTSSFKFTTGDKHIRILDNTLGEIEDASTYAEGLYSARGLLNTTEETIARIRNFEVQSNAVSESDRQNTETVFIDPVAQSFLVNSDIYPEGIFLSKVTAFFRNKDENLPVTLQIRPTVNGFPHSTFVMPLGSKTLLPASVLIPSESEKGDNDLIENYGTEFEFDSPVYLQPGEYCIVIMANSNNYEVYTAEIGQRRLGKTQIISEQPYTGSFFKSQNSSTWTPEQTIDLMFVLNICEFTTNANIYAEFVDYKSGVVKNYTDTTYIDTLNISNTLQTFPSTRLEHSYVSKTKDGVYSATVNNLIPVTPNSNITMSSEQEILGTNVENFRYRVVMRTSNKYVSPVIDSQRTNLVCIENQINNYTDLVEFSHGTTVPIEFTVGEEIVIGDAEGTIVEFNLKQFTFDGSSSSIVDVSEDSIELEGHELEVGESLVYSPGSGATGPIGGLASSTTYYVVPVDDDNIKLTSSASDAFLAHAGATGVINITSTAGGTAHTLVAKRGTLGIKKTNTKRILVGATAVDNNSINCTVTSVNSEENPIYGGALARYFNKIVTLNNESDYISVHISALKKKGTDIKVYYKIIPTDSNLTTQEVYYKEMTQAEPTVTDFSINDNDFKDFVFVPEEETSVEPFTKFLIKIVMLSENKCNIPKCKDMRAIALDVI